MKRFEKKWAVLKWKPYYEPRFGLDLLDQSVEYFDRLEDAISYAKLMKEEGWRCLVVEAIVV